MSLMRDAIGVLLAAEGRVSGLAAKRATVPNPPVPFGASSPYDITLSTDIKATSARVFRPDAITKRFTNRHHPPGVVPIMGLGEFIEVCLADARLENGISEPRCRLPKKSIRRQRTFALSSSFFRADPLQDETTRRCYSSMSDSAATATCRHIRNHTAAGAAGRFGVHSKPMTTADQRVRGKTHVPSARTSTGPGQRPPWGSIFQHADDS